MTVREQRAEAITDSIRQVLLRHWDPIGVMDDPECSRDEYDSYIGKLYRYLASGKSAAFIAEHLCAIEEKQMGLGHVAVSARLPVANKLKALNVSLGG